MSFEETFWRLAAAVGCGFVLGVERGWTARDGERGHQLAGVRTFSLAALAGGVFALLAMLAEPGEGLGVAGAAVLIGGVSALAVAFIVMRAGLAQHSGAYGATTLVAAILAVALGATALLGEVRLAVAATAAAAILLNAKDWLHGLVERLSEAEMRAALRLLAMSALLLPVLPNKGFGPWGALNPFEIWLIVVLISTVSFVGYVAVKTAGPRRGPLAAAAAGGLVSSTAVTLTFARRSKEAPETAGLLAAGVGLAGLIMYARMAAVALAAAPALGRDLVVILGVPALTTAAVSALIYWASGRRAVAAAMLTPRNPFDLSVALKFAALLAVIMVAVAALREAAGPRELFAAAFVAGLADVDAGTLSFSRAVAAEGLAPHAGAIAIGLVGLADTLTKTGLAVGLSSPRGRFLLAAPLASGAAAGAAAIAWALKAAG